MTAWTFWDEANHIALLTWCAIMLLLAMGGGWFFVGYQRDSGKMSRSAHTRKWWNNMRAIAFLTGLTWGSSALLHLYTGSVVFSSVLYLLTLGVLAGGATSGSTDVATLTLKDLSTNQDACKGVTPVLSFSAAQGS